MISFPSLEWLCGGVRPGPGYACELGGGGGRAAAHGELATLASYQRQDSEPPPRLCVICAVNRDTSEPDAIPRRQC